MSEAREDVQTIAEAELNADSKLGQVIAWQLGNGWSWVRPEDIGALTDAPILSDDIEYDDQGDVVNIGAVYWYPCYDVADPVAHLLSCSGMVMWSLSVSNKNDTVLNQIA